MDALTAPSDPYMPDTQPNKRRRKKSIVWEYFTIETINGDCTKACCKQCKKSFAYISGSKLSGTSHLKRHILGICPVSKRSNGSLLPSSNGQKGLVDPFSPGPDNEVSQSVSERPRKRYRANPSIYVDQQRCGHEYAKMIIQQEYPLTSGTHSGFSDIAQALHPNFNTKSISSAQEHITSIYSREKQSLMLLLNEIPGRISLTLDFWSSDQSLAYVLVTGHFTDMDWKLHRRIFNVIMLPFPESETVLYDALSSSIADWNTEGKLFALTHHQPCLTEKARASLRGLLTIKNSLILNGQLIVNSCYACTLTGLACDALDSMKEIVDKVRHSVKHVKTSQVHEERFFKLKQKLQVPSTKNLLIDDVTKWNTTYQMLMAASELKEVFSCLDTSDPDYKSSISMDEWGKVEILCSYLKHFYEAASILTSPVYPTTNTFFHEVWKIQLELMQAAASHDQFVRYLTQPLHEKFTKYWNDCNLVLAAAAVMDPRFKMKLVEFSFSRVYGDDAENWIRIVEEGVHELFLEYIVQALPPPTFLEGNEALVTTDLSPPTLLDENEAPEKTGFNPPTFHEGNEDLAKTDLPPPTFPEGNEVLLRIDLPPPTFPEGNDAMDRTDIPPQTFVEGNKALVSADTCEGDGLLPNGDGFSDFDVYVMEVMSCQHMKSELNQYLEEPLLPRVQDFDVLGWWKGNRTKYPTLSKMACDVLSIPLSTVQPALVFSTRERKMDRHQSLLAPATVQALICAKDWLQYESYESPFRSPTGYPTEVLKTES